MPMASSPDRALFSGLSALLPRGRPVRYGSAVPRRAVYDFLYRIGAARWKRGWDAGPSPELEALVHAGTLTPEAVGGTRAVDLGCGSGANTIFLAQCGFDATGVDFSGAAIEQARSAASQAGVEARFVVSDVTKDIPELTGPFDLIVLYNVLQDLDARGRRGLAEVTTGLGRPGSRVLLWCWFARRGDLPPVSYRGPSRLAPFVIEPGEERALFPEDLFELDRPQPQPGDRRACFLLTRR